MSMWLGLCFTIVYCLINVHRHRVVHLAVSTNLLEGLYILPMFFFIFIYLARSANLPTGLSIYSTDVFFLYFFNGRLRNTCISEANGLIFTKILGLVEGIRARLSYWDFLFFRDEKSAFSPDKSTLSRCHSETDCNIAISISNGSIEWIYLHCAQFWWPSVRKPKSLRCWQ